MPKNVKRKKQKTGYKRIATKCYFTETGTEPNYKDVLILRRFVTDRGKILHKSLTGLTSKNQRKLSVEIKKAQQMGLLPYTERHEI